jgi:hypothetical protein
MRLNFQQGIVTYPSTGPTQSFLAKTGVFVSLQTVNGDTVVNFAHGSSNYLFTEAADVTNAWGPIPVSTDAWLFWDIDTQTGVRTFGFTLLQPQFGTSFPVSPDQGQHFFDTDEKRMYLFDQGSWRNVIRVFAAMVNNSTFTPLGTGLGAKPFAGTQVGLSGPTISSGHILFDEVQEPIRRSNGEFFTTDSDIFTASAPASSIRIEASVLTATAEQNLGAYQVVYFSQFGKISLATYDDLQEEAIGILLEMLSINQTGTVIVQGVVTNDGWDWATVGAPLWIDGSGEFVDVDPHVSDVITFPIGKPPIARVLTATSIYFDQGLGGKGDRGLPGPLADQLATELVHGLSRLSWPANLVDDPIAVGDNDPRFDTINTELDARVLVAGDTMTGFLTLNANPTNVLHATPKQYVDAEILDAAFVELAGDTMTGDLIMSGAGVQITLPNAPLVDTDAANKGYVDGVAQGLSIKPAVLVATEDELTNLGDVPADVTYDNGALGVGATLTIQATSNPGVDPIAVTIDGHLLTATDVTNSSGILVKDEVGGNAPNNGRYFVSTVTATTVVLTRCPTCDEATEIPSAYIFVQEGTLYAATGWVAFVGDPGTFVVGTDDITWIQFSGAGVFTAGVGLLLTGPEFNLDLSAAELPAIATVVEGADRLAIYDNGALLTGGVTITDFLDDLNLNTTSSAMFGEVTATDWHGLPYDIAFAIIDIPAADAIVLNHVFVRDVTMADDFAGSQAVAQIAATASTVFDVLRNGASIGSITFAIAATLGTFVTAGAGAEVFAPGDVLTVVAPSTPDDTLADIAVTFFATTV